MITTVGPYQLYGEGLVAACAEAGTDYVDLCGEPAWMAEMIAKYDAKAKASGARIVFSCGFDSIPFDLGVVFLQRQAKERLGAAAAARARARAQDEGRLFRRYGGEPDGDARSLEARSGDPQDAGQSFRADARLYRAQRSPKATRRVYDDKADAWAAPFVMASINTKNVHRTNFLRGQAYGADFVYDEMVLTGDGRKGEKRAKTAAFGTSATNVLLGFAPTRALIRQFALPKPGQGPSKEERETGHYDVLFVGELKDGRMLRASVKGDKDPGYASTSKMISESAMCLIRDVGRDVTPGGVWTPGAALGEKLIARLEANAGLRFMLEN